MGLCRRSVRRGPAKRGSTITLSICRHLHVSVEPPANARGRSSPETANPVNGLAFRRNTRMRGLSPDPMRAHWHPCTVIIPLAPIPQAKARAIFSHVMTHCLKTAPSRAALRCRPGPRAPGRRDYRLSVFGPPPSGVRSRRTRRISVFVNPLAPHRRSVASHKSVLCVRLRGRRAVT